MLVLVFSDNHIVGTIPLRARVESVVEDAVGRFGERVTRVQAYLSDNNSHKLGDKNKRCVLEAHVAGLKAFAVSHEAPNLDEAVGFCADKLERTLDSTLGRLQKIPGRAPAEDQIASVEELMELEREEEEEERRGAQ